MRFYSQPHAYYCGIDLHTRTLSLCLLDAAGAIRLEATLPPDRDRLRAALEPFRDGLVIGCECLFAWYWLADWCADPPSSWATPSTCGPSTAGRPRPTPSTR